MRGVNTTVIAPRSDVGFWHKADMGRTYCDVL